MWWYKACAASSSPLVASAAFFFCAPPLHRGGVFLTCKSRTQTFNRHFFSPPPPSILVGGVVILTGKSSTQDFFWCKSEILLENGPRLVSKAPSTVAINELFSPQNATQPRHGGVTSHSHAPDVGAGWVLNAGKYNTKRAFNLFICAVPSHSQPNTSPAIGGGGNDPTRGAVSSALSPL